MRKGEKEDTSSCQMQGYLLSVCIKAGGWEGGSKGRTVGLPSARCWKVVVRGSLLPTSIVILVACRRLGREGGR